MNTKDARSRMFEEKLASAERKWEFRYNNQLNTIRELEATVKDLRKKIRVLKKELKDG
tara:strand:- start:1252 stop:1425 length:174 start_codon:yes stop_codon:yes gene_type:complete